MVKRTSLISASFSVVRQTCLQFMARGVKDFSELLRDGLNDMV